jgi:hypothetical protein
MEPHREEQNKAPPGAERKPKRFRIVKLEERIAPSAGGGSKNCHSGNCSYSVCACGTYRGGCY